MGAIINADLGTVASAPSSVPHARTHEAPSVLPSPTVPGSAAPAHDFLTEPDARNNLAPEVQAARPLRLDLRLRAGAVGAADFVSKRRRLASSSSPSPPPAPAPASPSPPPRPLTSPSVDIDTAVLTSALDTTLQARLPRHAHPRRIRLAPARSAQASAPASSPARAGADQARRPAQVTETTTNGERAVTATPTGVRGPPRDRPTTIDSACPRLQIGPTLQKHSCASQRVKPAHKTFLPGRRKCRAAFL